MEEESPFTFFNDTPLRRHTWSGMILLPSLQFRTGKDIGYRHVDRHGHGPNQRGPDVRRFPLHSRETHGGAPFCCGTDFATVSTEINGDDPTRRGADFDVFRVTDSWLVFC